jgi:hypothetical protein
MKIKLVTALTMVGFLIATERKNIKEMRNMWGQRSVLSVLPVVQKNQIRDTFLENLDQ